MAKEFSIECPCGKEVEFNTVDINGLDDHVADQCFNASEETKSEFVGMVDPSDLPIQPRMIHDLSQAIAVGNMIEARILCDRIAEELGLEHQHACEVGRFAKVMV